SVLPQWTLKIGSRTSVTTLSASSAADRGSARKDLAAATAARKKFSHLDADGRGGVPAVERRGLVTDLGGPADEAPLGHDLDPSARQHPVAGLARNDQVDHLPPGGRIEQP